MDRSEDTAYAYVHRHKDRSIEVSKVAHQLPHPAGTIPEAFVAAALDLDANERARGSRTPQMAPLGRSS